MSENTERSLPSVEVGEREPILNDQYFDKFVSTLEIELDDLLQERLRLEAMSRQLQELRLTSNPDNKPLDLIFLEKVYPDNSLIESIDALNSQINLVRDQLLLIPHSKESLLNKVFSSSEVDSVEILESCDTLLKGSGTRYDLSGQYYRTDVNIAPRVSLDGAEGVSEEPITLYKSIVLKKSQILKSLGRAEDLKDFLEPLTQSIVWQNEMSDFWSSQSFPVLCSELYVWACRETSAWESATLQLGCLLEATKFNQESFERFRSVQPIRTVNGEFFGDRYEFRKAAILRQLSEVFQEAAFFSDSKDRGSLLDQAKQSAEESWSYLSKQIDLVVTHAYMNRESAVRSAYSAINGSRPLIEREDDEFEEMKLEIANSKLSGFVRMHPEIFRAIRQRAQIAAMMGDTHFFRDSSDEEDSLSENPDRRNMQLVFDTIFCRGEYVPGREMIAGMKLLKIASVLSTDPGKAKTDYARLVESDLRSNDLNREFGIANLGYFIALLMEIVETNAHLKKFKPGDSSFDLFSSKYNKLMNILERRCVGGSEQLLNEFGLMDKSRRFDKFKEVFVKLVAYLNLENPPSPGNFVDLIEECSRNGEIYLMTSWTPSVFD